MWTETGKVSVVTLSSMIPSSATYLAYIELSSYLVHMKLSYKFMVTMKRFLLACDYGQAHIQFS
jgi:hypothetical protein